MFGYQQGELIGQSVSVINDPNNMDAPQAVMHYIITELQRTGLWSGEVKNIRKDGTTFWCSVNIVEFDHPEYGPVWLSVQQDISAE